MFWVLVGTSLAGWEPTDDREVKVYNSGVERMNAGKSKKAVPSFELALELEPDCGMCAMALGQALYFENRSEESYQVLLAVAADHGEQDGVYLWRSRPSGSRTRRTPAPPPWLWRRPTSTRLGTCSVPC
ncbi:MAG: tetratricopeptide repeat protein [Proteobacteria bacterium]|nr:tetratricopeptide repeat protein [Pseudomonadota bacterium]MCP4916586.1 tetratricopeptide repeat protein [Pseudomonadota bacterium]